MNETTTDMYHEEAQDPEDEQNHRDRPQHVFFLDKGLTSFALSFLLAKLIPQPRPATQIRSEGLPLRTSDKLRVRSEDH